MGSQFSLQAASQVLEVPKICDINTVQSIIESQSITVIETVILGIASSLVATFILLVTNWFLTKKLLPWYGDRIYRGVRIDGKWLYHSLGGNKFDDDIDDGLNIIQKGDQITGTYSHQAEKGISMYNIKGDIRDSYVTITIWPIARDELDAGSMVLRIYSKQGLMMKGKISYLSTEDGNVLSNDVEFVHRTS